MMVKLITSSTLASLQLVPITNILIRPQPCTSKAPRRFGGGEDHFSLHGGGTSRTKVSRGHSVDSDYISFMD